MTLLTPICLPLTPSHEIFTQNFRLHRAKLLKSLWIFRSTQNPTPERADRQDCYGCKTSTVSCVQWATIWHYKILKAKQLWHHFINKKCFTLFLLVSLPSSNHHGTSHFREYPCRLMTNKEAFRVFEEHTPRVNTRRTNTNEISARNAITRGRTGYHAKKGYSKNMIIPGDDKGRRILNWVLLEIICFSPEMI